VTKGLLMPLWMAVDGCRLTSPARVSRLFIIAFFHLLRLAVQVVRRPEDGRAKCVHSGCSAWFLEGDAIEDAEGICR
jgi:hypothetical protein